MFQLSGAKWGGSAAGAPSEPILWSVGSLDALDYNRNLYSEDDFLESLGDAFQAWEDVSGLDFEMVDAGSAADITVQTGLLPGNTVGTAEYTFIPVQDAYDVLVSAEITMDTEVNWSPEGGAGTTSFSVVAMHEIGHAIGLGHVNDSSEIMNASISSATELGEGDIEGAQELYGDSDGELDGSGSENDDDDGGDSSAVLAALAGVGLGAIGLATGILSGPVGIATALVLGGVGLAAAGGDDDDDDNEDGGESDEMALADPVTVENAHEGCDHGAQDDIFAGVPLEDDDPDDADIFAPDAPEAADVTEMPCGGCGVAGCASCGPAEEDADDADIFAPDPQTDPLPTVEVSEAACGSCGMEYCAGCEQPEDNAEAELFV